MKMPPRTRRPIQIIARRRLSGLDCIMGASVFAQLVEEIAKDFVAHDTRVWKRLAFCVKYRRWRLIHVIELTKCDVFLDCHIERAALYQRADLDHLGRREHSRYGAIHVAGLLPP